MRTLGPDNLRFDFSVGEDAIAITIADVNLQLESFGLKHRVAAAEKSDLFLVSLPEDGGIGGRFCFGELDESEEQNWVARATRSISISTGKFAIDGGGFFGEEVDVQVTETVDFVIAQVPPGDYELTCYVYLCSNIATDLFKSRKLSYIDWFRKTHIGAAIPAWLVELAEDRDNEFEDERLEVLSNSDIDDEAEEDFVELLFQLNPIEDRKSVAEVEISKRGRLKWEKRLPIEFPHPILTSGAVSRRGTSAMSKLVAKAFASKDFQRASTVFVDSIQSDVVEFLAKLHASISEKMSIPSRIIVNTSFVEAIDWLEKIDSPKGLGDSRQTRRFEFAGSKYVQLDDSKRNEEVYVGMHLGFVKTGEGLRAFAIELDWKKPQTRKRRRIQPADDAPTCPECGEKLMTAKAKQCLSCDAAWH